MPRLDEVTGSGHEFVQVPSLPWLQEAVGPGFIKGGVYLVAGEPGIGKTTLALQILGDLAQRELKVLYLTTEQALLDLKQVVKRLFGSRTGEVPPSLRQNFLMDDSVDDIDRLPNFLARRVLTEGEEYNGCSAIVVDSVQGRGLHAAATQKYRALYQFCDNAKAQRMVTFLVGHVTKKGQIAGPKDLEHNVDCVIYLRRAFRLRPMFVPKNRFAPAVVDPIVLLMDDKGRLIKSPHTAAQSTAIFGYAGISDDLAEAQASVSLPKYGSRPELNAPFLPGKKVRQLHTVMSSLKDVDLADLSYQISCYIPGPKGYRAELDLPLAVALLSSYLQQAVDKRTLFVGELDLTKRIRPPQSTYLAALAELVAGPQKGKIKTVYLSADVAADFAKMRPSQNQPPIGEQVKVQGVDQLETLIWQLWPNLVPARATS